MFHVKYYMAIPMSYTFHQHQKSHSDYAIFDVKNQ